MRALLHRDLDKIRRAVDPMITVPVDDTTRAAIYSFVYNVGRGVFPLFDAAKTEQR